MASSLQRTSPDLSAFKQLLTGKQPSQHSDSSKRTGPDIKDAEKLQSAGKLVTERPGTGSISTRRTGPDSKVAVKYQSAGKLSHSSTRRTGPDLFASTQQSTGKPVTDHSITDQSHASLSHLPSPALHLRCCTDRLEGTVSLVLTELPEVNFPTNLQWNCLLKRENCWIVQSWS